MQKRAVSAALLAFGAVLAIAEGAQADVYPSRPITMVVPFAAGGPSDTLARIVADGMKTKLGQPIIMENTTGAGGSLGVARGARAAPDGYTIILGNWATHVVNGAVHSLPYDLLKEFEPVSLIATQPLLIIAKKDFPAKDLKELVTWMKTNPRKASVGAAGIGSSTHIAAIFLAKETGAQFQLVPYRGGGPQSMQDLLGGQIDLMFTQASNALPHLRNGGIKAYAVTADKRLATAPEIPTADEAGLPGLHVALWHAIWAPKGTPKEIIVALNAAVIHALADQAVSRRLTDIGQEIFSRDRQTPEALAGFHKAESEKWVPIIKAANIKVE